MKSFYQIVKISTYSISVPSFIVMWREIAKLEGGSSPVFLGWQKAQSK